jgi:hypothetical protein
MFKNVVTICSYRDLFRDSDLDAAISQVSLLEYVLGVHKSPNCLLLARILSFVNMCYAPLDLRPEILLPLRSLWMRLHLRLRRPQARSSLKHCRCVIIKLVLLAAS